MVGTVEIELEHDTVRGIDLVASGPGQEGAQAFRGAMADQRLVAGPFEEFLGERCLADIGHVEENRALREFFSCHCLAPLRCGPILPVCRCPWLGAQVLPHAAIARSLGRTSVPSISIREA